MAEIGLVNSKTRIDKAGETLRGWMRGETDLSSSQLRREVAIVDDFRTCHAGPLKNVAAGIRYYIAKHSTIQVDGRPVVAQRLKRMRTIADKLLREPEMRLSQMHDIGGCRALFGSIEEMRAMILHLEHQKRWSIRRVRDYVAHPKSRSGYRAIHVIVEKAGLLIEIQLRTISQHAWAELIEGTDRRTDVGLKADRAPDDITEYYRLGSNLLAQADEGASRDPDTLRRFQELHEQVQRKLRRTESK
ncbi:MAG TPA: RelA/SpoT domain-containing protein [Solirubrobacterales bacterium]|nr:RelA/SpoT domain-containing protein [Solirubrobacterales bacterium]